MTSTTLTPPSTTDFDDVEEAFDERTRRINDHLRYIHEHVGIPLAVDTETDGLRVDDGRNHCIGVSVAYRRSYDGFGEVLESFYVAFRHVVGTNDTERVQRRLAAVLQERHPLIFANVQFDWLALRTIGIDVVWQEFYDIITMSNMVNENWPRERSLDNLAKEYLPENARKVAVWPWEARFKLKTEKTTGWPHTTPYMMDEYARVDTELTYRVWEVLVADRRWSDIPPAVWEHKQEFIRLLLVMRVRGIRVDEKLARHFDATGTRRMREINDQLGLDLNKPGDKEELFLNRLGLPVIKRGKPTKKNPEGAPSFDKFVMAEYEPMIERLDSPVAKLFKEYQGWKTAVTAMYRVYVDRLSPDGRLRTEFTTHVTRTGRLSSKNPNLQQIPKETDKPWSGRAKECFVAEDGWGLVNADFSQLELRIGTGYAKEPELIKVFETGDDVFDQMTEQFRTLLPPQIAKGWGRGDTKTLVYSMQYGAGKKRLMGAFGVGEETAQIILDTYREAFPRFRDLNRAITLKAEAYGEVRTWSGRVRHLQYESDSYKAMNSVIQGGAADIVERVMLRLYRELDDPDRCRILLTVHDSVVFEIREELIDEYMPRIEAIMSDVDAVTAPDSFGVKFAVEVERWKYTE